MLKTFSVPLCSGSGGGGSRRHHSSVDCQEDGVTLPELLLALWWTWHPSSTAECTSGPASPGFGHGFFFFFGLFFWTFPRSSGILACRQSCRAVLAPPPARVSALQTHFTSFSGYASFRLLHSHHVASGDSSSSASGGEVDPLTCSLGFVLRSFPSSYSWLFSWFFHQLSAPASGYTAFFFFAFSINQNKQEHWLFSFVFVQP